MIRSSTKELITPFENPESVFRSKRRLFETPGLVESSSPELDLISDIEEHSKDETTETMPETMAQYMSKTWQYLQELRENTFSGSEHEDVNEHIKKSLETIDLIHIPEVTQDQGMLRVFPMSLTRTASRWLRNESLGSITNWETLKTKFLNKYYPPARTAKKMEEINNFQQEPDESEVILFYNGLNVPTRQILDSKGAIPTKTVADAKIAIQEMAKYSQKWHNRTEIKKVNEKVYAAQVGCELCKGPQHTKDCPLKEEGNTLEEAYYTQNSSYPDRRHTLEESLTKFMAESAKRHEENSNIIKEIRASTDLAIRNQGASIKTLEIQIGQMSNVLQERGIGGANASVMPFSTYTNLGLGILSHTRLTIELADKTIKQPRGNAKNVLVRIGKFIFPIDFIILDIPEDDDVLLILGRPFLSTAHSKIDVHKIKITLRVGEVKLIFKSIKLATSIIRRVFMLKDLDSKTKLIGEDDESFDPLYGNYIELNDLDTPLELETNEDFELTFVNEPDSVKTSSEYCYKMKFSCIIGYKSVNADFIPSLSVSLITKSFYYSIIKDKGDHEGKSLAGALIDILVFVGNFSILTGFIIINDDDVTRDVTLGMRFFKKYVSCQMVMKKFAHGDKCERMMDE
ncbi:putative reverse transcriptase domain-containing protein [Tanacetum coccineum]|uniref:Reverse transcriptase domain-containing protein n=1 Tax=Tanacetum coccineum TaxID=301880 RepID=A0ABQ5EK05_9ASTR